MSGDSVYAPAESPVFSTLLPSFLQTASETGQHRYTIYVGYDNNDPVYDSKEGQAEFRHTFDQMLGKHNKARLEYRKRKNPKIGEQDMLKPELVMAGFVGTDHARNWVTSNLMQMAYDDGNEYLFHLNDDSQLIAPGWEKAMTQALKTNPTYPNFGATGPRDKNWGPVRNRKKGLGSHGAKLLLTHAFVHRSHLDIHGRFFPKAFKNGWSDDWITSVYGAENTFVGPGQVTLKHHAAGESYAVNTTDQQHLPAELERGRKRIEAWLASRVTNPDPCGITPFSTHTELSPTCRPRHLQVHPRGDITAAHALSCCILYSMAAIARRTTWQTSSWFSALPQQIPTRRILSQVFYFLIMRTCASTRDPECVSCNAIVRFQYDHAQSLLRRNSRCASCKEQTQQQPEAQADSKKRKRSKECTSTFVHAITGPIIGSARRKLLDRCMSNFLGDACTSPPQ
jgi:hypothetical protein